LPTLRKRSIYLPIAYDIIFKRGVNNLEDKTFELLTKMYADFTAQFKEVKEDIKTLKSNVSKIGVKLENDTDRKLGILLETRDETNKHLEDIENKIDIISAKVEKQDVEIRVIKGAK
jgi:hypothetical protein